MIELIVSIIFGVFLGFVLALLHFSQRSDRRSTTVVNRLRAENADLRHAGDAMYQTLNAIEYNGGPGDCMDRWEDVAHQEEGT